MTEVANRIEKFNRELPKNCTLVAVSKTKPSQMINDAYNGGHRHFGENKVQELVNKAEELPKDINWHMIGHLQRNKVKYIAPFVHLIHGVDSMKLLAEINKQGLKNERVLNCLLQVHIAEEETKFGFTPEEIDSVLAGNEMSEMKNVKVVGLMGMATNTPDEKQVREEFRSLKSLFDQHDELTVLSMGMSGDYELALKEGSNMIRVGSAIFGARNYPV